MSGDLILQGGPVPATPDRPGYLIKRAQSALNTALAEALRGPGATVSQYAALTALAEEPGLSNADLARRAFVTPQTMNQVLRELESRAWVTRHPDPSHARILRTALTPAGQTVLAACERAATAVEDQMLAPLSPTDRTHLAESLRTCVQALTS
jgi:DNA-binding MarR family transcriptional regulator